MQRKKPFSHKQKKQQLQEKRKEKQERVAPQSHKAHQEDKDIVPKGTAFAQSTRPHEDENSVTRRNPRKIRDLRTVFEREPKDLIDARIEKSRQPIPVRDESLRTADTNMYRTVIDFPQRPAWDYSMTKEELEKNEERKFEQWLRTVYETYPRERLNYFEHNLEVWRQLWRVCEISDVLVILADVRHPLFHFPPSLYKYITQVLRKPMVLVLNKIDLVTEEQVDKWVEYFHKQYPDLEIIPFTSHARVDDSGELENHGFAPNLNTAVKIKRKKKGALARYKSVVGGMPLLQACAKYYFEKKGHLKPPESPSASSSEDSSTVAKSDEETPATSVVSSSSDGTGEVAETKEAPEDLAALLAVAEDPHTVEHLAEEDEDEDEEDEDYEEQAVSDAEEDAEDEADGTSSFHRKEDGKKSKAHHGHPAKKRGKRPAIEALPPASTSPLENDDQSNQVLTIGFVGHPNVGKSSLINGLKQRKVVSTSRTPGHTKHFQTIYINKWLRLCDCPGLVFPALDMPRELQILCGIYPMSQAREPYSAIQYLAARVKVEDVYGLEFPTEEKKQVVLLPSKKSGKGKDRSPSPPLRSTKRRRRRGGMDDEDEDDELAIEASFASQDDDDEDDDLYRRMPKRGRKKKPAANLPLEPELEEPVKAHQWSAFAICEAYALKRGYLTKKGVPEAHRAGLEILRDTLDGIVLLYFDPPVSSPQ